MPRNLEIKVKVDSFDAIRESLNEIHAEDGGLLLQKDIYYESKSGLAKLRVESPGNMLIHYNRNEGSGDRWSDYRILNITGDNVEAVLADILPVETVVEKKRELYWYDNTRIHLDTVENLGLFLELETKVMASDEEAARQRFQFLFEKLELAGYPELKLSYRDLMLEKRGE